MIREATVREGLAATERCRRDRRGPHLIIVDMQLPDGTGLDLLRQVRRVPELSSTPVLVLSGEGDPKTVGLAYALGANCFVPKTGQGAGILESLESLYDFWLNKAVLPEPDVTPVDLLQEAINLRRSVAEINFSAVLDLLFSKGPVMAEALCELLTAYWTSLADGFEQEEDCPELLPVAVDLRRRLDVIAARLSLLSR